MILRTPADIGALIRQRRQDAGMDQAGLAQLVGVSRWWINEIEKGKPRAELALVLRTLTVLGVTLASYEPASAREAAGEMPSLDDVIARARGKAHS